MTRPTPARTSTGPSILRVGVAACAACCAVPAFGLVGALVAGASAVALAVSGLLLALVVAAAGTAWVLWRRRRAERFACAPLVPTPVTVPLPSPGRWIAEGTAGRADG